MFQFSAVFYHEENKTRKPEVKQQCILHYALRKHRKLHFPKASESETQAISKPPTAVSAPVTTVQMYGFITKPKATSSLSEQGVKSSWDTGRHSHRRAAPGSQEKT